jgi:hypothetical protein
MTSLDVQVVFFAQKFVKIQSIFIQRAIIEPSQQF